MILSNEFTEILSSIKKIKIKIVNILDRYVILKRNLFKQHFLNKILKMLFETIFDIMIVFYLLYISLKDDVT